MYVSVSCVTCKISYVMCHMSRVMCHMTHYLIFKLQFFWQSDRAIQRRVCYQRGVPRLFIEDQPISHSLSRKLIWSWEYLILHLHTDPRIGRNDLVLHVAQLGWTWGYYPLALTQGQTTPRQLASDGQNWHINFFLHYTLCPSLALTKNQETPANVQRPHGEVTDRNGTFIRTDWRVQDYFNLQLGKPGTNLPLLLGIELWWGQWWVLGPQVLFLTTNQLCYSCIAQ